MLVITLTNDAQVQWHTDSPKVSRKDAFFKLREVTEVQADGDELFRILEKATNLPHRTPACRVQNWFGDDAKWIVANIVMSPW
jgi:hypothetical protein